MRKVQKNLILLSVFFSQYTLSFSNLSNRNLNQILKSYIENKIYGFYFDAKFLKNFIFTTFKIYFGMSAKSKVKKKKKKKKKKKTKEE